MIVINNFICTVNECYYFVYVLSFFVFFFFFFQAEDGIRDLTVTGVQTCALPISIGSPEGLELTLSEGLISGLREFEKARLIQTSAAISPGSSGGGLFDVQRSEERRVGKECRSRWSPYH